MGARKEAYKEESSREITQPDPINDETFIDESEFDEYAT